MNNWFVFLLMIFLHIIDDYTLQGWLASAKQKKYWTENAPQEIYKYDYICALLVHSFSWAFMIMLPIAFIKSFNIDLLFVLFLIDNMLIHAYVDNEKANKFTINLWQDQIIHFIQIIFTFIFLI